MFKKAVLFSLLQIFSIALLANVEPDYHTVKPHDGDGIYSLLRRYSIENECDKSQFLKINNLDKNSFIKSHMRYKLPIYLYKYDGRSIRSTINDDDWDRAVRIRDYNQDLLKKGIRKKTYANSRILWVTHSELHCDHKVEKAAIPTKTEVIKSPKDTKGTKVEKLFGTKYEKYKIEDNSLKNKVYYVVSGHGGPDPGARCVKCPSTLCEDEYSYDIALRLARNLMQHGATVHIIVQDKNDGIRDGKYFKCDKDERVEGKKLPLKQKPRLVQRASAINRLYRKHKKQGVKDQVAIFLHVDSNSEHKQQDVFFYHHKHSKSGKKLATKIRDTFDSKYKKYQRNRGYKGYVKSRGLYVLNFTQPTAVFVELANIRNKSDHKRLLLESNRQAVANWLFDGLR